MNQILRRIEKPQRWDQPFCDSMGADDVERLLACEPFRSMRPEAFPANLSLAGLLRNDCRLRDFQPQELILRQGAYGNSAFLILEGQVFATLRSLPVPTDPARQRRTPFWSGLGTFWNKKPVPEVRGIPGAAKGERIEWDRATGATRVFVQDLPGLMDGDEAQILRPGTIFGELSALARTPRVANVVAQTCARLLEIRWQGLRDLMKFDGGLKHQIDQLYRRNGLMSHLSETPWLKHLDAHRLSQVAAQTEFQSLGEYQWTSAFRKISAADIAERIQAEPVIALQGEYLNGLVLIRSGFVRVSRQHGHGEQTIEYLGKGRAVGWRELYHNWKTGEQRPWQLNYRAIGYVDLLRIPTAAAEEWIFPDLPEALCPPPLPPLNNGSAKGDAAVPAVGPQRRLARREPTLETPLLENIVERRLMNGTEAMVIDLNRCTRCDDCVRACAASHQGNPRFVRDGLVLGHWMFANACMHCLDPVCMIGCPTGAIAREPGSGAVTIREATCIGCGTCAQSCPYGAIKMVAIHDSSGAPLVEQNSGLPILQATKCDLCVQHAGGPACQRACPHDALVRIDLSHPRELTQWIGG